MNAAKFGRGKGNGIQECKKGRLRDPSMSFGPVTNPDSLAANPKEDVVQAEGCPVKTATFPLPVTQTEISLDIGPPSFHYVDDDLKVGGPCGLCKASYVT